MSASFRHHDIDLRSDRLLTEDERIDGRTVRSHAGNLLACAIEQCLAGAHGGAHGFFAGAGTVIAHVAFHHEIILFLFFGYAERTGHHAIGAADTARGIGAVDHSEVILGDGIGRAYLCTYRVITMHAHLYSGLNGGGTLHIIDMDHAFMAVGLALRAGHLAGATTDAALHVNEKFHVGAIGRCLHTCLIYIIHYPRHVPERLL